MGLGGGGWGRFDSYALWEYVCVCLLVHVCMHVRVCVCVYTCIHAHAYLCMLHYIHAYYAHVLHTLF